MRDSSGEVLEGPYPALPIVQRLKLGHLAATTGIIEAASVIGSLAAHDSTYAIGGTILNGVGVAFSVYDAHNHHVNGYDRETPLVKERQWFTNQG